MAVRKSESMSAVKVAHAKLGWPCWAMALGRTRPGDPLREPDDPEPNPAMSGPLASPPPRADATSCPFLQLPVPST
jgi:hypothetical protein